MFDIIIRGGTIIDGTGNVGFKGDLVIEGDRLKILVGDTSSVPATRVIDARRSIVAPGFIDVHTHSSLMALAEPRNEPKIGQGITTEIVGLDGLGCVPLSKKNQELILRYY